MDSVRARLDGTTAPADLCGQRVYLREYELADALLVAQTIRQTPSLARWVPDIARHRSVVSVRAAFEVMLAQACDGRRYIFGIWRSGSDEFLGEVGLYHVDPVRKLGEVGYWLRDSARGQGFATEAFGLLVGFATGRLGLTHLEAHIGEDNQPSRAVAARCGFASAGSREAVLASDPTGAAMLIYRFECHAD